MGLALEVLEQVDKAATVVMDMVSLGVVLQEEVVVGKIQEVPMAIAEEVEVVAQD